MNAAADTAIHRRVAALRAQADPTLILQLPSGWAVFGEQQFLRGYCLLLPDPVVPHLNAMPAAARSLFLEDLARFGDALLVATGAVHINYAMYGNVEPALHAHLIPRYSDESEALRTAHPWAYDWSAAPRFEAAAFAPLRERLRALLA